MSVQSINRSTDDPISESVHHGRWQFLIILLLAIIALGVAYQPVLFNFFTADDFHFFYLFQDTKENPVLLLRSFVQSIGPYYRPIMNTTMFCEYLLFGLNSIPFRLVSLVFKSIAALLTACLVNELASDSEDQQLILSRKNWCIASAILFALYPLHTEPIDWVMCQVDLLTNLFMLSSFWFYLRWRNQKKLSAEILSCILYFFALMTKEVAVAFPLIISAYELIVRKAPLSNQNQSSADKQRPISPLRSFFKKIVPTMGHSIILIFYLGFRIAILGSLTGTWKVGTFYNPTTSMMMKGWLQSFKMILIPLSSTISDPSQALHLIWIVSILISITLTVLTVYKSPRLLLLSVFLLTWFFICLAPMYKLLYITPDLLNARYGYLASVPLCAFLTLGLAAQLPKAIRYWPKAFLVFFICLSAFVLRNNNLAWAEAGQLTNNIVNEIRRVNRNIDDKKPVYIINLPFVYNGVAIEGMDTAEAVNHKPFSEKDHYNCFWLRNNDQSLPLGLLSESIKKGKTAIAFFAWNMKDQKLHELPLSEINEVPVLEQATSPDTKPRTHQETLPPLNNLGTPEIELKRKEAVFTFHPSNLNCWGTDFIVFQITIQKTHPPSKDEYAQLFYANKLNSGTAFLDSLMTPLNPGKSKQSLIFPVRGIPFWTLGGYCHTIILRCPKDCAVEVDKAYSAKADNLMPRLILPDPDYNDPRIQMKLTNKQSFASITYKASYIKNCAGVALEAIDAGEYFPELNSLHSNGNSSVPLVSMHPNGQIILDRNMFANNGTFKVRLRPIDNKGNQIGFCSDHFIVSVIK